MAKHKHRGEKRTEDREHKETRHRRHHLPAELRERAEAVHCGKVRRDARGRFV